MYRRPDPILSARRRDRNDSATKPEQRAEMREGGFAQRAMRHEEADWVGFLRRI